VAKGEPVKLLELYCSWCSGKYNLPNTLIRSHCSGQKGNEFFETAAWCTVSFLLYIWT